MSYEPIPHAITTPDEVDSSRLGTLSFRNGYPTSETAANLADELAESEASDAMLRPGTRILDAADHLFATLACHSARRAGEVLEREEQRALLDALDAIPWAPCCPHGRPVAVRVGIAEIERRFARI